VDHDPVRTRGASLRLALLLFALGALALGRPEQLESQRFFGGGSGAPRDPNALWGIPDVRNGFYFCRLMYDWEIQDPSGTGWRIEYPRADQNFMTRLSQLTSVQISSWRSGPPNRYAASYGWPGMPGHTVVQATDPELFSCPFVMMSSPGSAGFTPEEVQKLREYLLKGGFLWGDDFWGYRSWDHWAAEIAKVLPEFPIVELKPGNDPVFQTFYSLQTVPQIPSLNRFNRMGGSTSELGEQSAVASMHAIFDSEGRPMVLMSHNTDIADGWEREADLDAYFQRFAWQAYSVGVNVMMWIMTR
jgi:hypothetical protein